MSQAHYLRNLGPDAKTCSLINAERSVNNQRPLPQKQLSIGWQNLIKAAAVHQLLIKRNTSLHVTLQIVRPLKVIATCTDKEPWQLNLDDLYETIRVGKALQASGKLSDLIVTVVKVVLDAHHILDAGQIYPLLKVSRKTIRSVKSKHTMSQDELRANLEARKHDEKLPERRAFWELIRIVMTEKPRTYMREPIWMR